MSEHPYRDAAPLLLANGWKGVIPLPPRAKYPPPDGYTGRDGCMPSGADVHEWIEHRGNANVGIRLPGNVIGIDVDDYGGKGGGATLQQSVDRWGALIPTWRSTSRSVESHSGIQLYRVPEGLHWPGDLGPGIEIIQYRHRYMVAPPSVHPSGATYRWVLMGEVCDDPPAIDALPWLPATWVLGLSSGRPADDAPRAVATAESVQAWQVATSVHPAPCGAVLRAVEAHGLAMMAGGSRHDATVRSVLHVTRLGAEGHHGVQAALRDIQLTFHRAVAADRSEAELRGEWDRLLAGAVNLAAAGMTPGGIAIDPCLSPLGADPAKDANTTRYARFAGLLTSPDPPEVPDAAGAAIPHRASPENPSDGRPLTSEGGADTRTPITLVTVPGQPGRTLENATFGDQGPMTMADGGSGGDSADRESDVSSLDAARQAVIRAEMERLRIRREAARRLEVEESLRTWREPPSWELASYLALADEPLPWTVEQIMPEGTNVLITAQYKTGKTTLVINLAKSLADNRPFLGAFPVHADSGRIGVWNYEVSSQMFASWFRKLDVGAAERIVGLDLRGYSLPLGVPHVIDWIVEWLKNREVHHWIIDPWGRAIAGIEENSNAEVGKVLETLDSIKERAGVLNLIIPTHTGRAPQDQGAERARGATRLDDWADVRWILTTQDGNRFFRAHGRDVDLEEGALHWDELMKTLTFGEGAREPEVTSPARGRPRQVQRNVLDELIQAIGMNPGLSARGLSSKIGRRRDDVARQLALMAQQHMIKQVKIGRTVGWYLPSHPEAGE